MLTGSPYPLGDDDGVRSRIFRYTVDMRRENYDGHENLGEALQ